MSGYKIVRVVLEEPDNDNNISAIMRTLNALTGSKKLHIIEKKEKKHKASNGCSSGASQCVSVVRFENFENFKSEKSGKNYGFVVEGGTLINEVCFERESNLFFGNEKTGLSETVKKQLDELVSIPEKGVVKSLNLATAVGIGVYAALFNKGEIG